MAFAGAGEDPADQDGWRQHSHGCEHDSRAVGCHSFAPAPKKKLIKVTAPPQRAAATNATSTPVFPLPASTGLTEGFPTAHTIAEIASPAREATRPTVSSAPTMFSSSAMPGSPLVFGLTLTPPMSSRMVWLLSWMWTGWIHAPGAGSRRAISPPETNVAQD